VSRYQYMWTHDEPGTEDVPVESVKAGDMLEPWLGRVLRVEPYTGPMTDVVHSVAYCDTGRALSLCHGDVIQRRAL
jgi:hypothetical protein